MRSWRILPGVIAAVGLASAAVAEEAAVVPSIEAGDLEADLGLDLDVEPEAPAAEAAGIADPKPAEEAASSASPAVVDPQPAPETADTGAATEQAVATEDGSLETSAEVEAEPTAASADESEAAAAVEGVVDTAVETEVLLSAESGSSASGSHHAISLGPEGLDTQGRRGRRAARHALGHLRGLPRNTLGVAFHLGGQPGHRQSTPHQPG
jgi:hypothetical protein